MLSTLVWPEVTTHGATSRWARGGGGEWKLRPGPDEAKLRRLWAELEKTSMPGVKLEGDYERITGGPGLPGRHCWYCGSIHPGDLYELLTTVKVKLGGADWKYGWPHKFYVETPNPRTDGIYVCSSSAGGPCAVCRPTIRACSPYTRGGPPLPSNAEWPAPDPRCSWCSGKGHNPSHLPKSEKPYAYPTLTGKFYNEHLEELKQPAFEALAAVLRERTGIEFGRNELGKLTYRAPYRGYQA